MNWIESAVYGFFAGLSDILPVSAQAHRMLLTTCFGEDSEPALLRLLIHIGTLCALYYGCQNHILRIARALKLAQTPKRLRKRPLDSASIMDFRLLQTMVVPVIIGFFFHHRFANLVTILSVLSFTLFVNSVILFLPRFLPGCNKASLSMSPLDGITMGIGAVGAMIPGISCVGVVTSVGTVRGGDRLYILNMAFLLNIAVTVGFIVLDVLAILGTGVAGLSFVMIAKYLLSACAAFAGSFLAMKLMRWLAQRSGFGVFAFYCFGLSLFTFILFLSI